MLSYGNTTQIKTESVLEVREEDYKNPISKYNDGDTKVELNRAGSFYFISGADGHCQQGLRLDQVVRSGGHGGRGHDQSHSPSPSPSPAPAPSPAPTPVTSLAPAPAPTKNGGAALGSGGFVGLVTGLGVTLLVMMI